MPFKKTKDKGDTCNPLIDLDLNTTLQEWGGHNCF